MIINTKKEGTVDYLPGAEDKTLPSLTDDNLLKKLAAAVDSNIAEGDTNAIIAGARTRDLRNTITHADDA